MISWLKLRVDDGVASLKSVPLIVFLDLEKNEIYLSNKGILLIIKKLEQPEL